VRRLCQREQHARAVLLPYARERADSQVRDARKGRGASANVLAELPLQQSSSISSLHGAPAGHTWPEVICCLSGRGLRISRPSAAMQTTQYADLQHFLARYVSSDRTSCCPSCCPEARVPRLYRQQNWPICR
jgi:hypothetical protein